jgi:hypothetical protein
MLVIPLVVDPQCEHWNEQDYCCYEDQDFHALSVGP